MNRINQILAVLVSMLFVFLVLEGGLRLLGFTPRWVRRQIEAERLIAYAFDAGDRRSLRIRSDDLDRFMRRYFRDARALPPKSER